MAYRASPPRVVPDLKKTAVGAVEVLNTDFDETDFVSLSNPATPGHQDGYAVPRFAILPDKHWYDQMIFSFGIPTLGAADNEVTLNLLVRLSDGTVMRAGQSVLDATNSFPQIIIPNHDARYYVQVAAITGTTPAVTVDVIAQGLYDEEA